MEAAEISVGGISTLESATTRRALDSFAEREARWTSEENNVRDEITVSFSLLGRVNARNLAVPWVDERGGPRERSESLRRAILEMLSKGDCEDELMAVVELSSCPKVQALRDALRKEWQDKWVQQVAELRA